MIREQFDFSADFKQFLRHYSATLQSFGLKVLVEIDYEMGSYLRSFLIQNIVFRKNIHAWSFYILIMYLWYRSDTSILSKSISKLIRNIFILLPNDSSWNSTSSKLRTDWNWPWAKNDSYAPSFFVRNGLAIQIPHPRKLSIKLRKISLFSRLFLMKFWSPQITVTGLYRLSLKQLPVHTGYRLIGYSP